MISQVLSYWLVIQALGLAGLPATCWLLRSLPDQGYGVSKPLALLLLGWAAWFLAMLGLVPFGAPLLLLLVAALALGGWWLQGRVALTLLRQQWRLVLGYEVLFLAGLLFVAWMRGYQPDPWGTERAMDYAFFNTIRQGGSFPPQDPWLAGYSINYYYLGYLLMATVAMLSGLTPAVAYNLSLALLFALAAVGVASAVLNMAGLARLQTSGEQRWRPGLLAWGCALLAVVGVLLAGNLSGAAQVIAGSERVVALDGRQLLTAVGQGLGGAATVTLPYSTPPIQDPAEWGEIRYWQRNDAVANFNWWWPSRALWDDLPDEQGLLTRRYVITEFPFFSFWLGDMHPHVMSLPFTLLALTLALATLARPALPAYTASRAGMLELVLSSVVLGSLYVINSWDLPTYLLLFAGSLLVLHLRLLPGQPLPWRAYGGRLLAVAVASFALFLPFHLTFRSLVGGKEPLLPLPIIGRLTSILGFFGGDKTNLSYFVVIFGLFLLPLLAFVLAQRGPTSPTASLGIAVDSRRLPSAGPLVIVGAFVVGLLVGFPLLALLPLGCYAVWQAVRSETTGVSFGLLVAALGCFVCFGTELVYIRDVFEGMQPRFNTIFKFYYQTWLLWGTLSGFALWWLLRRASRLLGIGVALLTLAVLAAALVYPVLTAGKLPQEGQWRGLAGITPREESAEGLAAVAWLRANAASGAVVLEAVGGQYSAYAGVSAATGLPTVLGWPGHESQWRGGDPEALAQLGPREQDVRAIYTATDAEIARRLLRLYDVDYIFLGDLERSTYSIADDALLVSLSEPVFSNGSTIILKVRP